MKMYSVSAETSTRIFKIMADRKTDRVVYSYNELCQLIPELIPMSRLPINNEFIKDLLVYIDEFAESNGLDFLQIFHATGTSMMFIFNKIKHIQPITKINKHIDQKNQYIKTLCWYQ